MFPEPVIHGISANQQLIFCFEFYSIDPITSPSNCTDYDVRLHHATSPNRGTLQICVNGVWSDVCVGGIGHRVPEVVCAQLGYQRRGEATDIG